MCFSRRSFSREEQTEQVRKDPVWRLFDREQEAERPGPVADRERDERDAGDSREKIPVGAET